MRRDFGKQARAHGLAVAFELALDFGLPLVGVRLDALVGEFFVDFQGRVVESEFDDREVRGCRLEIVTEAQIGESQFGLIQIRERIAEVDAASDRLYGR